nr:PREDICTED: uncharacterized protein LOC103563231 [Equus przewalskii]
MRYACPCSLTGPPSVLRTSSPPAQTPCFLWHPEAGAPWQQAPLWPPRLSDAVGRRWKQAENEEVETKYEGHREVRCTNLNVSAAHSLGEERASCLWSTPSRHKAHWCQGVLLDNPPLCSGFLYISHSVPSSLHPVSCRPLPRPPHTHPEVFLASLPAALGSGWYEEDPRHAGRKWASRALTICSGHTASVQPTAQTVAQGAKSPYLSGKGYESPSVR